MGILDSSAALRPQWATYSLVGPFHIPIKNARELHRSAKSKIKAIVYHHRRMAGEITQSPDG